MIDLKEIVARLEARAVLSGLLDCHIRGLHSIVLEERADGSLLRIFYATARANMDRLFSHNGHFQLGAHNHDKELSFKVLHGQVYNVSLDFAADLDQRAMNLFRYPFRSALTSGAFGLGPADGVRMLLSIQPLDSVTMRVTQIHTVLIASSKAVWVVDEGPRDPLAEKFIYSPRPDLTLDSTDLYRPMKPGVIANICDEILLSIYAFFPEALRA